MIEDRQRKLDRRRPANESWPGGARDGEFHGAKPKADSVGDILRARREAAGLDLRDVAGYLRIRYPHLLAMEEGRFEELPGRIYAIGFLRTYAEYLGLDANQLVEHFKAQTAAGGGAPLSFPAPAPETRTPGAGITIIALLLGVAVYGGWYYSQTAERWTGELIAPVPERLAEAAATASQDMVFEAPPPHAPPEPAPALKADPVATEVAAAATPVAGAASAPPPTVASAPALTPPAASSRANVEVAALPPAPGVASAPETPAAAPPAVPAPPPAVAAAAAPPAVPPAVPGNEPPPLLAMPAAAADGYVPQTYGSTNTSVRVVLRANAESWIDVRGANNEILLPGRVLRPGDSFRVPDRPDAVLWTGNLGALEFVVDGQALPRIGRFGEARRNISLDASRLLAGNAAAR